MQDARKIASAFVKSISHKNINIDVFDVDAYITEGIEFLPDTLHNIYKLVQSDENTDVLTISFKINPASRHGGMFTVHVSFMSLGGKVHPYDISVKLKGSEFVDCFAKLFHNCPNATLMDLKHDEDTAWTYQDIVKYLKEKREIFRGNRLHFGSYNF